MTPEEYMKKYAPDDDLGEEPEEEVKEEFNSPEPFVFQGAPEPDRGVRYITPERAFEIADDPELRKALDVIQKENAKNFPKYFANKALGIKKLVQKQLIHDMYADAQAMVQKKIIEMGMRKKRMK